MGGPLGEAPKFYTAGSLTGRYEEAIQRLAQINGIPSHLRDDRSYDEVVALTHESAVLGAVRGSVSLLASALGSETTFPVPSRRIISSTIRRTSAQGLTPLLKPDFPARTVIAEVVASRAPHPLKTVYDKRYLKGIVDNIVAEPDPAGFMWYDRPGRKTELSTALGVEDLSVFPDEETLLEAIAPEKSRVLEKLHLPSEADIRVATPADLALLRAIRQPAEGATRAKVAGTSEQVVFNASGIISTRKPDEPVSIPPRFVIVLSAIQKPLEETTAQTDI